MNNPNVKFISKEKLLNSPEIYHKVNSSKTADEGCNNKWKQSLFQLFFEITKKDNDNLSFLQPPGKFRYQCPPYFCNIFILTANYYTSDKITYNKIRNVLKYYDSSSIQDVEFFFRPDYSCRNFWLSIGTANAHTPDSQYSFKAMYT